MRREESRTASGMPLISLYNKSNANRITIALSDPSNPTTLLAGVAEKTGRVRIQIDLECEIAKKYGMDTVIVDDGWQTDDNSRGYAYCGDWQVCENKIPDMKCFVDKIYSLGMKFMIWFSVPFVGLESKNYERFKGMYLNTRENVRASVLDFNSTGKDWKTKLPRGCQ